MKKIFNILIISLATIRIGYAQAVNLHSATEQQKNIAYVNLGYDYGFTAQAGYGRIIKTFRPLMLNIDYSFPMGKNLTDDFKVRYGGQIELIEKNGFALTARIIANFRRHQTEMVRIIGFGSEFSALAGYYRPRWHAALEFGFDKSIITHIKHSGIMREYFPGDVDSWYMPSGGHYFYGLQAGRSIGRGLDVNFRLGATRAQNNDVGDTIPWFFQAGLIKKF